MRFNKLFKTLVSNNLKIETKNERLYLKNFSKILVHQNYSHSTFCIENPIYENAVKYWNNVATEDKNRKYTYGEIHSKSLQVSQNLKAILGDEKQEQIALLLPNDVSYVISQWATWRAGHAAVPLHPMHPLTQLKYFVEDSQSRLIITNEELASKFKPLLSSQQVLVLEDSFLFSEEDAQIRDSETRPQNASKRTEEEKNKVLNSNALIVYTSGTTGPPKGVVLSHGNLCAQVSALVSAWRLRSSDVLLHCLPLHHVHGVVNALLCPLYCGARVVMEPEFNAAAVWSKLLNLHTGADVSSRVSLFMAVPTIYAKLIDEYHNHLGKTTRMREFVNRVCTENIRLMVSGSAPLPEPILERWRSITGHVLLERYGMTEVGMALTNPLKGQRTPGFVGTPFPGVRVKIVQFSPKRESYETICEGSDEGTMVTPGREEESGELLVKGPNVFREYWGKEEATKKEFTNGGWFCTGDTAAFVEGKYKILGRSSVDIIKSGGFKVSALDVERVLLSHPRVRDVAVVGIPDITWGEKIACLIQWDGETDQFDPAKLRSWAKERLPHYQVPSVVKPLFQSLPRNNMGKVNKKEILKQYFPESLRQ